MVYFMWELHQMIFFGFAEPSKKAYLGSGPKIILKRYIDHTILCCNAGTDDGKIHM